MKSLPRPVRREDLLVLWTVREARGKDGEALKDVIQVRGRVYYKDDPVVKKPRALVELLLPDNIIDDENVTMTRLIEMAEERLTLDIKEINGEHPFDDCDTPGVDEIRKAFER